MQYKAPDNSLHFLSDEDIANGGEALLPAGCVQITDEEAEAIRVVNLPASEPAPAVEPVDKLKAFLTANPDVAALLA